ncbi:MAG: hypothetical protein AAGK74_20645, partial [Chloroflexota bacterium]
VGGVSISGGKGSAFGAALGTITIALLEIGLQTFMFVPAYVNRLAIGTLLVVVIVVELGAQWLDRYQTRRALLRSMDERRDMLDSRAPSAGD